MLLAAIESSSLVASVAIWADGKILAEYSTDDKKTHSQTLLPMLEEIVGMTGLDMNSLDAIVVSQGPGSFTGLRIGSATAKGLALALDIPIVEVPTLKAMAYQLYGCRSLICPIMDARRGQVYTGLYTFNERMELETLTDQEAVSAQQIIDRINEIGKEVIFLGDGVPVFAELIRQQIRVPCFLAPAHVARQRAGALAALGAEIFRDKGGISSDLHTPVYLRLSQAERERKQRQKGEVTLRLMTEEDTRQAAVLEEQLFSSPWSRQALLDTLKQDNACYVTAVKDNQVAGYCGLYLTEDEGYINQVAVDPALQGCGIGRKMLAFLLQEAARRGMKACTLEVRKSNERALALYKSLGFTPEGERKGFYENPPEDALILWKR